MLARGMGSDREEGQQGSYTYKGAACFVEEAAINLSIKSIELLASKQSSIRPSDFTSRTCAYLLLALFRSHCPEHPAFSHA